MIEGQNLPDEARRAVLASQKGEITENGIYRALALKASEAGNRKVLEEIAAVEQGHYGFFRSFTGTDIAPDRIRIAFYLLIYHIFGITFSLKLMERGEKRAQKLYRDLLPVVPGLDAVLLDEEGHEKALIGLIDERRFQYTGVIVMAGLITGIAAALSMGSAEYLSTKSEGGERNPLRAAMYTGIAY